MRGVITDVVAHTDLDPVSAFCCHDKIGNLRQMLRLDNQFRMVGKAPHRGTELQSPHIDAERNNQMLDVPKLRRFIRLIWVTTFTGICSALRYDTALRTLPYESSFPRT